MKPSEMRTVLLAALLSWTALSGCTKADGGASGSPPLPEAEAESRAVEEGICKEHHVLSSLCTRCNPSLAAIFKESGDWCVKHDFPESICPTCHPERGGKPAEDVTDDGVPADGTKVKMKTPDAAALAGISTVKAAGKRETVEISAPVLIAPDPNRRAQVTARSSGIVKSVQADIGSWVKASSVLAVIESPEIVADQSRLEAAKSRLKLAESTLQRESELEKKGISAKKEVLAAEHEVNEARAACQALANPLAVLGARESGGGYSVTAPISGVITERTVTTGRYVAAQEMLFEIVDSSVVWAEIQIPEKDVGAVRTGQTVTITLDGLEGRQFHGSIASISPAMDPQTRTTKARVSLSNPGGFIRANMYGRAKISVGGLKASVLVPRDAIQQAKEVKLAFVKLSEQEFELRRVQVAEGNGSDDFERVVSGLSPGEEIVVAGGFLLKTETLKDSIGAGCCDVGEK